MRKTGSRDKCRRGGEIRAELGDLGENSAQSRGSMADPLQVYSGGIDPEGPRDDGTQYRRSNEDEEERLGSDIDQQDRK
jgi:hypothetical protein